MHLRLRFSIRNHQTVTLCNRRSHLKCDVRRQGALPRSLGPISPPTNLNTPHQELKKYMLKNTNSSNKQYNQQRTGLFRNVSNVASPSNTEFVKLP